MTIGQSVALYYLIIIITFLIVNFSEIVETMKYKKLSILLFWVAFIFPFFISATRYGIGTDYFNYVGIYDEFKYENNLLYSIQHHNIEPGWIILNYLVNYLIGDVQYIFIISSFLTLLFFFMAFYHFRERISLSISIFILLCTIYNLSFNISRQTLAMAILLFSLKYIEKKKIIRFICFVFFAFSFHYTSLIFLPIYWIIELKHSNWGNYKKIIIYLFFMFFILWFDSFIHLITNLNVSFSKYSSYQIKSISEMGFGNIIIRMPLILIIIINYQKLKQKDLFMNQIITVYFISILLYFLSYLGPHMSRIAFFYEMVQMLLFSSIIKIQNNLLAKYSIFVVIILYYLQDFTYRIVFNNYGETIPYVFYSLFK